MDELKGKIIRSLTLGTMNVPASRGGLEALIQLGAYAGKSMNPEEHYHLLSMIAQELIKAKQSLPNGIDDFVLKVLSGKLKPPSGPKWGQNLYRDAAIQVAVKQAVDYGLAVYRNDTSKPESACDLVSECLEELGIKLSYQGVAKIWRVAHT